MSNPQTILNQRWNQEETLTPDSSATFTRDPSAEARVTWGQFLAVKLAERDQSHEEMIFSTPGVIEALDEAIAEVHAAEDSQ